MLLTDFTPDEEKQFEQAAQVKPFAAGETLVREGDPGESLFLVCDGKVEVRKELGGDNYKHLKDLGPGDFFGEMALLGAPHRTAGVIALAEGYALEIPLDALNALLKENPAIGCKLYRNMACELAVRLRRSTEDLKKALVWAFEGVFV